MTILDEIMAHKRDEIAQQQARRPLAEVRAVAEAAPPPLDFVAALRETRDGQAHMLPHSPTPPLSPTPR